MEPHTTVDVNVVRPLDVMLNTPPAPPSSPWVEPTKYVREIARWITGGVFATVVAVATGSSLTRLGSLDPSKDTGRLALAGVGLALALVAVGLLGQAAIGVLTVESASLDDVSEAKPGDPLWNLKQRLELKFRFLKNNYEWPELVKSGSDVGNRVERSLPFYNVSLRFERLVSALPCCVVAATAGLVLFAWAANPPEPKAPAEKGVILKIAE